MAETQTNGADPSASSPAPPPSQPTKPSAARMPTPPPEPGTITIDPTFPASSLGDSGLGKRPKDARLLHLLLAELGIAAYQDRVPLQLMDLAYRYSASVLQDALHLTSDAATNTAAATQPGRVAHSDHNSVSVASLRLSIASRAHYQFGSPGLPKEQLMESAQERNRVALPPAGRDWGMRLPPERYCLTGVGFGLKEEWESEGEEDVLAEPGDVVMEDTGEGGAEEGDERMEDIFGEDYDAGEEDKEMAEE